MIFPRCPSFALSSLSLSPLPPASALSSPYLASCCSPSISHALSSTPRTLPPRPLSSAPLVCVLISIFSDTPFLFISRSFCLCLNLPLASLSLWESICNLVSKPSVFKLLGFIHWLVFLSFSAFSPSICLPLSVPHLSVIGFRWTSTVKLSLAPSSLCPISVINNGWIRLTLCFAHY